MRIPAHIGSFLFVKRPPPPASASLRMVVTSACTLEVHYIDVVPAYLVVVKDDTLLVEEFEKIGVVEDVGGLAYASGGMRGRHGKERDARQRCGAAEEGQCACIEFRGSHTTSWWRDHTAD